MNCLLCNENNVTVLEKIDKQKLLKLYKKMTGIDFEYLIKEDIYFYECKNCKLRFYKPTITGDEKFYNALQKFEWYYLNEKEEYFYARKFISSSDKVLEVGSGKGAFAKHIPTKNYVGLDFSKNAKEIAAKNGVIIENETIQDYAIKHKEEFDVVLSFQVLEHVSDPKGFIESKLNALKQGGKLIIAVPSEDSFLRYAINSILNMPPHHVTRWRDITFEYIANKYNLKILEIYHEKVQQIHYLWYLQTLIINSIYANKLLDDSFLGKIVIKFANVLSRILVKGLKQEMLPNGHTVIVVYQK